MKVKYAEKGTFEPEKAARGLIELFNRTNIPVNEQKTNDKAK